MRDWAFSLFGWWYGHQVGIDSFGNRYYETKKSFGKRRKIRRWVHYKGLEDPSKVPAKWHGWLHFRTDDIPRIKSLYSWQQPYLPNLTGTCLAHKPNQKNPLYPFLNKQKICDYEPWTP